MSGTGQADDDVKVIGVWVALVGAVLALISAALLIDMATDRDPKPVVTVTTASTVHTPPATTPTRPPATWTGYQGTGYPGCVHEDGSGVGAGPCVLDCESDAMDQWCRPDEHGLWLRWPDQRQPDRPVRIGS